MFGRVRLSCAAAALFCLPAAASAAPATNGDPARPAQARVRLAQQQSQAGYDRMAIPKPSQRRTGELEGWSKPEDNKADAKNAARQKTSAAGRKGRPVESNATAGKERDPEDGGLPLPKARTQGNDSPVMFDGQKVGTGLRF